MPKPPIHKPKQEWDDATKKECAYLYALKGTYNAVSRATGVPDSTIGVWAKSDWWLEQVGQCRAENEELFRARFSQLVDKGTEVALAKLPDATAKDAMIIAGVATDKLRVSLNLPTSITGNQGSSSAIQALAQQFQQLSQQWGEKQVNVVSDQTPESEGIVGAPDTSP